MSLEYPLPNNDQKIIEKTPFQELKSLVFRGGLPIFTVERASGTQGEIWLEDLSGSVYVCAYVSGTKYKIKLT